MYCNSRTNTHTRSNIVRGWGGGRKCQELFDFAAIRMQLILLGRGFIVVVVVDGNGRSGRSAHSRWARTANSMACVRVWRVQCWYELRMYIVRNTMCMSYPVYTICASAIDGRCIANISTHELHTHMWDGWFVVCCVILDILPIAASLC